MQGFRLFTAVALVMALAAPAGAAIYKWVDEKGVTHYGEKAPEGAKPAQVKVTDTTSSDAEDELKALNERRNADAEARKKAAAGGAGSAPSAEDIARHNEACQQHRKNLETLRSGKRVRMAGDDGQPRALSDEDVANQIKFAESELQRCEQQQALKESVNKAPVAPAR